MDMRHHMWGVEKRRRTAGLVVGVSTLPFTDYPSRGTSSELEAGGAGESIAFNSEEEVCILRKRILFIKKEGGSRWG